MSVRIYQNCDYHNLTGNLKKILREYNISGKRKIFIKPNFSGRSPIIPGENTDPEFLRKLTAALREEGTQEIIIGHTSLLGTPDRHFPFEKLIQEGGYSSLLEESNVKLINLDNQKRRYEKYKNVTISVPESINECDVYINLAKIKTHIETKVSLSLKNQMGLPLPLERVNMHRFGLEGLIAFLGTIAKPDLNIIEGMPAMEEDGPHHGKPKELGIIFTGRDMVETDSVISFLMGFNFKDIGHIVLAEEMNVGNYPSEEEIKSLEKNRFVGFKKAHQYKKFGRNIYVWPTTACSRCITALNESGKKIKKNPFKYSKFLRKAFLGDEKIHIIIGRAENLKIPEGEKCIVIGRCPKSFSQERGVKNLDRCPPTIKETLKFIKENLD